MSAVQARVAADLKGVGRTLLELLCDEECRAGEKA
jgi:hypothetical protein